MQQQFVTDIFTVNSIVRKRINLIKIDLLCQKNQCTSFIIIFIFQHKKSGKINRVIKNCE